MRVILTLLFVALLCTCVRAQVGTRVDAEYASWCMVDSVAAGQLVRFTRLVNVATLEVIDLDPIAGTSYTPQGTLFTCEDYDLRTATRDPLADLYADCQCSYTISQEGNRVIDIQGGATQQYTVEFQEVVRRQCAGQAASAVVHRDTLTKTETIVAAGRRLQYGFPFNAPGQYLDQVDLRVYASGLEQTSSIDLNPNTVQASYPALSLDPADFTFSGSNGATMAAAWLVVINYVLDRDFGVLVNTVTTSAIGGQVNIFTELRHLPPEPYVITPRPGDADYSYLSTIPNNPITLGIGGVGLLTRTTDWTEQCEPIFEERSGNYLTWSPSTPRSILPILDVVTTPRPSQSNLQAFCDVPPAVCAELAVQPVDLGECVEICSDVLNIPGHFPAAGIDTTLSAATYNSVSVYVTAGPVGIVLDGERINYPTGWSTLWKAAEGKLLQNTIRIDATGSEAIISYVR